VQPGYPVADWLAYLLTDDRKFDILQSVPLASRMQLDQLKAPRVHHSPRQRGAFPGRAATNDRVLARKCTVIRGRESPCPSTTHTKVFFLIHITMLKRIQGL
jgi:hypothetical protein